MPGFRDYAKEQAKWITVVESPFYPDSLLAAVPIYAPVLERFRELLDQARDPADLLNLVHATRETKPRVQLLRVFRKYVSPNTPVEMLKRKRDIPTICKEFGGKFRDLAAVRKALDMRPFPDEALIAILNEYADRGSKGYTLTEAFFEWFEMKLGEEFDIVGPVRAGPDLNLHDLLPDYPKDRRPVDFVITGKGKKEPLVIGLGRYDSDRGGAQEDDRTSGYRDLVSELLRYSETKKYRLKLLFVNDGPGLLLGSMWKDYCEIEERGRGRVIVATLKMLEHRLTPAWIRS